jgi:hypothetical protein
MVVPELRAVLDREREALARGDWDHVAAALTAALPPDERTTKRSVRELLKNPPPRVDPWRLELVVLRTPMRELVRVRRGMELGAGIDDPEVHVRLLAAVARHLEANAGRGPEALDDVQGAAEAIAWLRGSELPVPKDPGQRRVRAFFSQAAHRVLGARGLVHAPRSASQDEILASIGGAPLLCASVASLTDERPTPPPRIDPSSPSIAVDAMWAEGVRLSRPEAKDDPLLLGALVDAAELAFAPEAATSEHYGFALWQAVPAFARALLSREHVKLATRLARTIADSGPLTGGVARRVARFVRWLPPAERRSFLMRAAYRTCVRRQRGASFVWKEGGLRQVVAELAREVEDMTAVGRLFGPPPTPRPEPEALSTIALRLTAEISSSCSGPFWETDEARRFLGWTTEQEPIPLVADLPEAAAIAARLPAAQRGAIIDLGTASGRHGERYGVARVHIAHSALDFEVLGAPDEALLEIGPRIDRALEALAAVHGAAKLGRAPRAELGRLTMAMEELPSARFWADVSSGLTTRQVAVRLRVFEPNLPWELVPVMRDGLKSSLGLAAPVTRERGRGPAAGGRLSSVMVLSDPEMSSAVEEAKLVAERWRTAGLRALEASDLDSARALAAEHDVDVLHFAGHQGPTDDATASLALRGRPLSLVDLEGCFSRRGPRLLFLHACSTAVQRPGDAARILDSTFDEILGTLWDVTPPDARFVLAFHDALLAGASAARALLAARVAVAKSAAWAGWWPAYVLFSNYLRTETDRGADE